MQDIAERIHVGHLVEDALGLRKDRDTFFHALYLELDDFPAYMKNMQGAMYAIEFYTEQHEGMNERTRAMLLEAFFVYNVHRVEQLSAAYGACDSERYWRPLGPTLIGLLSIARQPFFSTSPWSEFAGRLPTMLGQILDSAERLQEPNIKNSWTNGELSNHWSSYLMVELADGKVIENIQESSRRRVALLQRLIHKGARHNAIQQMLHAAFGTLTDSEQITMLLEQAKPGLK